MTRVNFIFYRMPSGLIPKWLNNTFDNISDIARNVPSWACYLKSDLSFMNNLFRVAFQPLVLHAHSVLHFAAFHSEVGWHSIIVPLFTCFSLTWTAYSGRLERKTGLHQRVTLEYHIYTISNTIIIYYLSIYTELEKWKFIFLPDSKSLINKQCDSLKYLIRWNSKGYSKNEQKELKEPLPGADILLAASSACKNWWCHI